MGRAGTKHRTARGAAKQPRAAVAPRAKPSDLVSSKIIRLANILRRSSTLAYSREFGLSQVEWRIVALLGEHAPATLNGLSDLMGLDKGQVSRGVSALVARRLVLREYRSQGRGIQITLSVRGGEVYGQLMTSALARNRVLLHGLKDDERAQLFAVLDRLTAVARTILEQQQGATGIRSREVRIR
jgi:DNA-binding MarR family transcriptional regulator